LISVLNPRRWKKLRRGPLAEARATKFLGGVQFAVFAGVVEGDIAVRTLLAKIDLASVEGLRINVDADGALVEFGEIQNLMDGLERVDISRMGGVPFRRSRLE